jgi:DNA-binding winged helix-turn-helix (wHTH) protein
MDDSATAFPYGERTQFVFARLVLDTGARLLLRKGRPVSLSTKAVEVLIQLVAHRPRAVRKEELLSAVWPNRFIEENHLSHLVTELRAALGVTLGRRAIRTVHGVGFAFALPAEARLAPAAPQSECLWLLSWVAGSRPSRSGDADVWSGGTIDLALGTYTIGRATDCTPMLTSRTVSSRHARLHVERHALSVEDLGSKNGTYLDGRQITARAKVAEGSVLTVGAVDLRFRRPTADATETLRRGVRRSKARSPRS